MSLIGHATAILSWVENLPKKDRPPRWMWHLDHELEAHFDRLEDERSSDDGESAGPMIRNPDLERQIADVRAGRRPT